MRQILGCAARSILAALALNAVTSEEPSHLVQAKLNNLETLMFYLGSGGQDKEVPLLEVLADLDRYFDTKEELPFPDSFEFPKSFQYDLTYAQVINTGNIYKMKVFEGSQSAIFDADNNRIRLERESRVFHEIDTQVKLYDFNKMSLLVSDPTKKLCMELKLQDISPVSMVPREHDQIKICDTIQRLWTNPNKLPDKELGWDQDTEQWDSDSNQAKTKYLGQHMISARSLLGAFRGDELWHVFYNEYSFLDLEESYVKKGGVYGTKSLYLFREKGNEEEEEDEEEENVGKKKEAEWQLAAVASIYKVGKPGMYANLGHTFAPVDPQTMETNEFQLKFYQRECSEYLDEYMLIDGNQLVKKVAGGSHTLLQ